MTRTARVFVFTACLMLAGSPAIAQDALSKRVSLDLKAMAPGDAFKVIADAVGMGLSIDPKITTPVDILMRDVTARTALTAICESIGCQWAASDFRIVISTGAITMNTRRVTKLAADTSQTSGSTLRKRLVVERFQAALKQPLPAGMRFENAPLSTVCGRLSEALGLTITMLSGDPATRTVTADFSNQTLMTALKSLGEAGNFSPVLRLTISDKRAPGDPESPSIMISFKVDSKVNARKK